MAVSNEFYDVFADAGIEVPNYFSNVYGQPTQNKASAISSTPGNQGVNAANTPNAFGFVGDFLGNRNYSTPSSIAVGEAPQGGLYGGNVTINPGRSAFSGIDPYAYQYDKKEGASRLSADVIRAQYQDYLNRFAPIEDFAVNSLTRTGTVDGQYDVARSRQAALDAGANLQGQQERAMGRYGLQMTAPNISTSNQVTGGVVAGMNQARMADADRRLQMLGGGAGSGAAAARG